MARGGFRPGAGRPRKGSERALEQAVKAVDSEQVPLVDTGRQLSPLEYMLHVMNDPMQEDARRDRMAIAAAPFVHPRKEPVGQGKRDKAKEDAERAADLFKPGRAPLKAVA